jgi:hypothetical protein
VGERWLRLSPEHTDLDGDADPSVVCWDLRTVASASSSTAPPGGAEYGLRTGMDSGPDGTLWFAAASARPTGWTFSLPTWIRLACT